MNFDSFYSIPLHSNCNSALKCNLTWNQIQKLNWNLSYSQNNSKSRRHHESGKGSQSDRNRHNYHIWCTGHKRRGCSILTRDLYRHGHTYCVIMTWSLQWWFIRWVWTKRARLPAQSAIKKIFTNMSMSIFCSVYNVSAVKIACASQEAQEHTLNESEKEQETQGEHFFFCV